MILYFSGTGNSEYVAKRIQDIVDDEVLNLFEKIKKQDFSKLISSRPWIIVAPTYAWRIPRILDQWLKNTRLSGNKDIYFVMTCGGNIGNAKKYLKKLCIDKNLNYKGTMSIIMPENYIAMFPTMNQEVALKVIGQAESQIDKAGVIIKNQEKFLQKNITLKDKINSSIINSLFYPVFVHAKKFYVTDKCINCKKCMNVCPLNNISFKNNRPVWGKKCTHCMACISHCPSEAIEYGKKSQGMPRYTFPKKIK